MITIYSDEAAIRDMTRGLAHRAATFAVNRAMHEGYPLWCLPGPRDHMWLDEKTQPHLARCSYLLWFRQRVRELAGEYGIPEADVSAYLARP